MSLKQRAPAEPIIALVVAMGENRAIGRGGDLPWHLRSDMRYFREITMGKPVIMGRRTFKSLPRVLDGRLNIVLTRDRGFVAPDAVMAYSLEEGLAAARASAKRTGAAEIMIIGGEDVFREVLPQTGSHLSHRGACRSRRRHLVPRARHEASGARCPARRMRPGPKDDHAFSFVVLDRVS